MKPDPLHFARIWLAIGIGMVGVTIWFSLQAQPPAWTYAWGEQWLHAAVYTALVLWFGQIYAGAWRHGMVALGFIVMGGGLELLQAEATASRRLDPTDMLANAGGAAGAWVILRTPAGRCLHRIDQWLARRAGRDSPDIDS